jgi:hypothetical protein
VSSPEYWLVEDSADEGMEHWFRRGSDHSETADSDTTFLAEEPLANAEYFGETVKKSIKVKPKGKGSTRALIASKRKGAILKKDGDGDIVMGDADGSDNGASKRKRAPSESE